MISRRTLLQLGWAAAAVQAPRLARAEPDLAHEGERFVLRNPGTGDALFLSARAPLFEFDGFALGGPDAGQGVWRREGRGAWVGQWRVQSGPGAEIDVRLDADAASGVVSRTCTLRLLSGAPALLRTVTLDTVEAEGHAPLVRSNGPQSYPALFRSFWVGVRFPIAFVEAEGERIRLGHRPGRRIAPGERYRTRTAVYGLSAAGRARESFESAIAALRPTPHGLHFNYNSWWTSPVPYSEKDILGLIDQFRRNLFEPYGVSPDTFCIDMGWAKNTTVWQIDPALFPEGFARLQQACGAIRSHLGLWISPSGVYGQALDLDWARKSGYEADAGKACLGGARYQAAFKAALLDHVSRYGIRHVKFDGYVPTCDAADHGHEPGIYSAERIAEGILDVFTSLRKVAPDLWMEPTCFGFDPSPWWLEYVNSLIGTFGDDAPHGRAPCPEYRQSYTTARDFYNLKGAHDILVPIAAQEVLGIVHQTPDPLYDDAVVTLLRGHGFVPLYVNPQYMSPRRWRFLAALMQWARTHADVLEHTIALDPPGWRNRLDAPMPRAPYGYGHWRAGRGLLCLRNPWIEPAQVQIVASRDLGAPSDAGPLRANWVYPRSGAAGPSVEADEPHTISLAPYETCVLAYTRGRRARVAGVPNREPAATSVTLRAVASWFEAQDDGPRFGPDYTRLLPSGGPYGRIRLSGGTETPRGDVRELLILVEGPEPIEAPIVTLTVGGRAARCEVRPSEAGWCAAGAPEPEHWLWLVIPLRPGLSELAGDILLTGAGRTVRAWVASRRTVADGKGSPASGVLPAPEQRWIDSMRAFDPIEFGQTLPTERGPAPVARIRGVYLDTLEPVEQSQGYGELERNRSVWRKPITIAGKGYLRGLGTHAVSRLVYALDGKWRRFQAWAGADSATGPTITMEVRVDGRSAWKSGLLTRATPAHRLDVDVRGARRLELLVGDGGNGIAADHADWADAVLIH